MQLELQPPYSSLYRAGVLFVNRDNRKHITLIGFDGSRTITSYARYLMSVRVGYIVPSHLHVDHINDDKSDDRIENLQVLTEEQNRYKEFLRRLFEQEAWLIQCVTCCKYFLLDGKDYRYRKSVGREHLYCSRECVYTSPIKNSNNFKQNSKSSDLINQIKQLKTEGSTSYSISSQLGIARNTVMKYW